MAYEIINREYKIDKANNTKLDGAICDISCDTLEDLPTAEDIEKEKILPYSWCWVTDIGEHRVLNGKGEWK